MRQNPESVLFVRRALRGGLASLDNITLMSPSIEVSGQASARLEKIITFAHQVHAPVVTIGSFRGRTQPTGQLMDVSNLKVVLKHCAEQAEESNVRLVIEPLNRYESNFINNVDEALQFMDEVGSPNLGILIDTFHANIEERSMTDCFIAVNNAHRLWHIHLGDSNRFPVGQGHIDFPGIFKTLDNIHYEGYLSAELLPRPDPDKAAALTIEHCRPLLAS